MRRETNERAVKELRVTEALAGGLIGVELTTGDEGICEGEGRVGEDEGEAFRVGDGVGVAHKAGRVQL